jgi:hypothetical protein
MHGVRNAYDPLQNIDGGVRHLRYLNDRYRGELDLVLAAYNAGTKPVDAVRGIPSYAETQEYVRRVKVFHEHYRGVFARPGGVPPATATLALASLGLEAFAPEDLYGRPIVLVGGDGPRLPRDEALRMSLAPREPAPYTPVPD